jgi:hypothetical protein
VTVVTCSQCSDQLEGADIRRTRGNPPPPLGTQLCAWGPGQGYLYQEKVAREAAIIGHDISDHQSVAIDA